MVRNILIVILILVIALMGATASQDAVCVSQYTERTPMDGYTLIEYWSLDKYTENLEKGVAKCKYTYTARSLRD